MEIQKYKPILYLTCLIILGLAACQSRGAAMTATVVVPTLAPTNTIEPTPTNALAPTNTTEPTPTLSPTKAATPVPTPGDDEILTFLINALLVLNNSPNRMEVTTDLGDGNTLNSIIEFVPPDKKYIVSIKDSVEYLIVGNMVYAKTASTGIWEETQIPASNFLGGPVTEESISDTISSVQWSRTDSLDGKAVIVISYTSHTQSGDIELESQTEIWIGKDDGLPYKMIIDGEVLSASTDPSTGESKLAAAPALTTTLIDFDSEINIEKPIP